MAKHFGREDRSGNGRRIAVHLYYPLPRTRRLLASPWVVAGAYPLQRRPGILACLVLLLTISSSHPLLPPQPHSAAPTHVQRAPPRPATSSEGPHPGASHDACARGGSSLLVSTPHPIPAWTPKRVCQ